MLFKNVQIHGPTGSLVTDVRVKDGHVTDFGPDSPVIDGSGLGLVAVVPATGKSRGHVVGRVEPGIPADLLLVPRTAMPGLGTPWWRVVVTRRDVRALLTRGQVVIRNGDPLDRPTNPEDARIGMWVDQNDWLHQELLPQGRYDETRGGRKHAYTGRYWLDGDRIDYLDDSGFYAFGEFIDERLFHAEFVMRRQMTAAPTRNGDQQ